MLSEDEDDDEWYLSRIWCGIRLPFDHPNLSIRERRGKNVNLAGKAPVQTGLKGLQAPGITRPAGAGGKLPGHTP